jgi:hypothetical protein
LEVLNGRDNYKKKEIKWIRFISYIKTDKKLHRKQK